MGIKIIAKSPLTAVPNDKFTGQPINWPYGFNGQSDDKRYLFLEGIYPYESDNLNLNFILFEYPKTSKIYIEKESVSPFNYRLKCDSNYGIKSWYCDGHTWYDNGTEINSFFSGYSVYEYYFARIYGTGILYTNTNYDNIIVTPASILDGLDIGFTPNPGSDPDSGGGNQDWGQGSPITGTTIGTFDNTSETVGQGNINSTKTAALFNNYYAITREQLAGVKNNIWTLQIPFYTKPSDAIISIMAYPCVIGGTYDTGGKTAKIGNTSMILSAIDNVYQLYVNAQNTITFGTLHLDPYFRGFQDYAPYTKIKIWLPFIGFRDLDPQYVQDKDVEVRYVINYTNGSCIALIFSNEVLVYRHNGQMGQTIPITQVNNPLIEATMSTGIQAAGVAAMATVNPLLGIADGVGMAANAGGSLMNIVNARPSISGSAGGGGEAEWSLPLEVFLQIERPDCAVAQTYNHEKGRPSLLNKELSKCKGFTSLVNPQVMAGCTQVENDMINNMLKSGVIING